MGDSGEAFQVVASVNQTPSYEIPSCDYDSSVVGGRHLGLGFHDDKKVSDDGSEGEEDFVLAMVEDETEEVEENNETEEVGEASSRSRRKKGKKRNEGFLSIGGIKLYTVDISSPEDDSEEITDEKDEDSCDSAEIYSSSDSESEELSSDDDLGDDSEIDEEVMEDYLEAIGGVDNLFKGDDLEKNLDLDLSSDDDDDSIDGISRKLGRVTLLNASEQYGMEKKKHGNNRKMKAKKIGDLIENYRSAALEDMVLEKDTRGFISKKKKFHSQLSRSWPNDARKSKKYKEIRGSEVWTLLIYILVFGF